MARSRDGARWPNVMRPEISPSFLTLDRVGPGEMSLQVGCPSCQKVIRVGPQHVGRRVNCPHCKAPFTVPGSLADAPVAASVPRPATPAPVDVSAPQGSGAAQTSIEEQPFKFLEQIEPTSLATERKFRPKPSQAVKGAAESLLKMRPSSDVSMLISGGIALAVTIVVCGVLYPLRGTYLGDLVLERGWVPPAVVLLASWSFAVLGLKLQKVARQRRAMLLDLLPMDLGQDITADDVPKYLEHLAKLPIRPDESYLINRVIRGLEHFRVRNSAPEVASVLASQGEIDSMSVDSSYTMVKVFIWAMPILGFIGTVIGISAAVVGLGGSVSTAESVSDMTESLLPVLGGLATAFDTTLIALVLSLFVKFPTSSMQKREEDLLSGVDEYCNDHLLKRLDDARGSMDGNLSNGAQLEAWTRRLEAIGTTLTGQVAASWEQINARLQQLEAQKLGRIQEIDVVLAKTADSMKHTADSLGTSLAALNQGLLALNHVLRELGARPVALPMPVETRRRSWAFWRSNGDKSANESISSN
ncbi:MAG: MotA/TolQ/ExbB proton channel family protein [Pirellulales bacterium]|nr:MotA/TolQ/ExbB proton channel family protein [Pirellulales bacterium]